MTVHILLNGYQHYLDIYVEKVHYSITRHQLELYENDVMQIINLEQVIDAEFRDGEIGFPLSMIKKL